jgi:formylglycine-generating enzyme required for sulfatase activity
MNLRQLHEEANRRLSADEVARYLDAPVTDAERENAQALCDWFVRRYPTPAARLAYVRRAYARWTRRSPA